MLTNTEEILKISKKYSKNGKFNATKLSQEYLRKFKNKSKAYIETGNILKLLGERKKSQQFYIKASKIDPSNAEAFNKLGISYRTEDNLKKAEYYYKKSISIDSNNPDVFHNLGNVLKEKKKYSQAIKFYQKVIDINKKKLTNNFVVKPIISIAKILECVYFSKGKKKYLVSLKKVSKNYSKDIRIATMSSYVSERERIKNIYPFCKNPIDYIYITNLEKILKKKGISVKNILDICQDTKAIWEPSARVTRGGYQTIDNLFEKNNFKISYLKKMINREVKFFFKKFGKRKDLIIKKKPKRYKIRAWFVKLISQGFQKSHIHPTAWLSGVLYLNIPKNLKNNQGSLKLAH